MAGLNFTTSKDGHKRASTWIQFRIDASQLAWSCAEVAAEESKNPRLVSKSQIENRVRRNLFIHGYTTFETDPYSEVEELYTEALDHVKGIYGA